MQIVSADWIDNQNQNFTTEGYVEITLGVGDPSAQEDANATDNGHEAFSDVDDVLSSDWITPTKFASLEQNIWALDGSVTSFIPSSPPYGEQGFIGDELSDENGQFLSNPTIEITLNSVATNTIPGFFIRWSEAYNEYARAFSVTVYNGLSVVDSAVITDNTSATSTIELEVNNYDRVVIEITEWCLPYHRARISSILLGIALIYSKSDIMSYSHEMSVDPLSASLPKSEITFEVSNLNGEYNPDNPVGYTQYLMERQSVKVRYGFKINENIEWIKAGTFYLSEWDMPQNGITASFTARDAIEFMSDTYSGITNGTLYQIATAALTQADLPELPDGSDRWVLDDSLKNITIPTGLDFGEKNIAEVLQLVANAGMCVFYQDRDGILHIEPLSYVLTDYRIDTFNSYQNADSSLTKQLKDVVVKGYTLSVGTVGETQKVDNILIPYTELANVAQWVADYLTNRNILNGEYRADPRLDPLDMVTCVNQYATSEVLITLVKYTFNGAFRGSYEGRQIVNE